MADKPSRVLNYIDGISDEYRYEIADAKARNDLANKMDKKWDASNSGGILTVASGGATTPTKMKFDTYAMKLRLRSAATYSDGSCDEYATIPLSSIRVQIEDSLDSNHVHRALSAAMGRELNNTKLSKQQILDMFYPVGTIYQTTDTRFDPADTWGGTWETITGRFLLSDGNGYTAGSTGGEAAHTLTADELPSHTHTMYVNNDGSSSSWQPDMGTYLVKSDYVTTSTKNYQAKLAQSAVGSGQAHNNMPPYLVVCTWKRIR